MKNNWTSLFSVISIAIADLPQFCKEIVVVLVGEILSKWLASYLRGISQIQCISLGKGVWQDYNAPVSRDEEIKIAAFSL